LKLLQQVLLCHPVEEQ